MSTMTTNPPPTVHARLATGLALLSAGLLAGAFLYGWANVAPTFAAVPLDVHLTYRVELMQRNGTIMPLLMGTTIVTLVWSAVVTRGAARALLTAATGLAATALVTTVFGNVPINGEIREWAAGRLPDDYEERLSTWGVFHDIRFAAAVGAFVLLILAIRMARRPRSARAPETADDMRHAATRRAHG
ncbi:DUF1772 domain-containing protein [Qaidamihabitans albus]|uniref:DUF1772 domain-containing protein n=1 Tax=Qaidamihabitans albus TaxID=2795733 RepID=UPI0018F12863|nr:DUF1772 domain-containing protein [Qaidamihabitans albus]